MSSINNAGQQYQADDALTLTLTVTLTLIHRRSWHSPQRILPSPRKRTLCNSIIVTRCVLQIQVNTI